MTQKAKKTTASTAEPEGFTDEERAAMKERARELKRGARRGGRASAEDLEAEVLAKIAEMDEPDRTFGARLHEIVRASAPELTPKLWYGMPAYARDGKVICYFQAASKFKSRYSTLGFSDEAKLDDGALWATSFALTELTAEVEDAIGKLVKKAVS